MDQVSAWLKGTVPGIVLLGAVGSIIAICALKALSVVITAIPAPYRMHRARRPRQAYFHGFISAIIRDDENGRRLISFLFFRAVCFGMYSLVSVASASLLIGTVIVDPASLGPGHIILTAVMFTASYGAYFEFEDIYRTYLHHWKTPLERAELGWHESERSRSSMTKGAANKDG